MLLVNFFSLHFFSLSVSLLVDYSYFHMGFSNTYCSSILILCVMEKLNIYFISCSHSCYTELNLARFFAVFKNLFEEERTTNLKVKNICWFLKRIFVN